jgi:hypothetical protein
VIEVILILVAAGWVFGLGYTIAKENYQKVEPPRGPTPQEEREELLRQVLERRRIRGED